jgi:hypothetical protein
MLTVLGHSRPKGQAAQPANELTSRTGEEAELREVSQPSHLLRRGVCD